MFFFLVGFFCGLPFLSSLSGAFSPFLSSLFNPPANKKKQILIFSLETESATSIHSGNVSADLAAQETSGFEATSSPTGPFLPHLNLRAAAAAASHPVPRKQPRADLHLLNATHQTMSHAPTSNLSMRHHSHGREWEGEDLGFEESAPPAAKRSKHAHNASSSVHHHLNLQNNISIDSGDESDSETALSPYGSTTSSLHRLLGAVENVLTEEREMASALAQLETVRTLIASVEETRKKTIGRLDQMLLSHLDTVQKLVSRESIESSILERAKAEADAREKAAMEDSLKQKNSEPQSETENKSGESNDNQSDSNQQRDANQREKRAVTAESQAEAAELAKRSENLVESAEARVESVMGPLRDQHHSILAPSTTLPVRLLSSLPSELESAATDLTTLFLNATLLQLGSQADVESFKQFFVQSLNQSKAQINVEVAQLFEALSALKTRQTQLGQNTFIDQLQLRNLSEDLHELKQRVVHASRAVQGAFVQLVSQFSEQIEAAKRVYQESAGNNVKLLDEIVRSQITPQLTAQIDISKQQLLAHVNCVRANLAYLDTLVLGTE